MSQSSEESSAEVVVEPEHQGLRLDQFLVQQFPQHSRVKFRRLITEGAVQVDQRRAKPSFILRGGERIAVEFPPPQRQEVLAEDIPLDLLYEDECIVVVNKPPAMVVHPSRGHWSGTLTSALQFHFDQLSQVGGASRPGIVHRLDRDTSGVIVIAKDDSTHLKLAEQFQERTLEKEYFAVVTGRVDRDRDWINAPIGMHPYQREKMAIRHDHSTSRPAETFYEVSERFDGFTVMKVLPKTGRTHQIRVHLEKIGNPILCDRQYGGRSQITHGEISQTQDERVLLSRQALHARRLKISHPQTHEPLEFVAPLPEDLQALVEALQQYRSL